MFATDVIRTCSIVDVSCGQLVRIRHILSYDFAIRVRDERGDPALILIKGKGRSSNVQSVSFTASERELDAHCLVLGQAASQFDPTAQAEYAHKDDEYPLGSLVLSSTGPAIAARDRVGNRAATLCWSLANGEHQSQVGRAFFLTDWQLGVNQAGAVFPVVRFMPNNAMHATCEDARDGER